jgi:hypothetical protein
VLDADQEAGPRGAVGHRGDAQRVPERDAVLAVVEQLDLGRLPGLDRGAQPRDLSPVGADALRKAAVAAQDLLPGIAGDPAEGVVGEDDRRVAQGAVADEHPRVRGRDGRREQFGAHPSVRGALLILVHDGSCIGMPL